MIALLRPVVVMLALFSALTGLVYPLALTGLARAVAPHQAGGSLIERDGRVIGSALIGQGFADARYFWGRPSAAGEGYDAANSGGANLGPLSARLLERVRGDVARLRPGITGALPIDAVTSSASGLDPDISPEFALAQVPRVATARGLDPARLRALVTGRVQGRALGLLGEPRVNVLGLNLALDALRP